MTQADGNNTGRHYWRSLDDLAQTPGFARWVRDEFPGLEQELAAREAGGATGSSRRSFLKLMAASLGLAGLAVLPGCRRWPEREVLPYNARPDGRVPGQAEYYATAMELAGVAQPLLVKSFDGRPIKIEGNPDHPASLGAASLAAQASVLSLYDPDRSRGPAYHGPALEARTWASFWPEFARGLRGARGRGLAILGEESSSLALADMRRRALEALPEARWFEYEPISLDHQREGTRLALGAPHRAVLDLADAEVIVALDADLLLGHPDAVRLTRQFAAGRRSADTAGTMNRLYVAESTFSVTGTMADHRWALRSDEIAALVLDLAAALGVPGAGAPSGRAWPGLEQLVSDLKAHRGRSVVEAGPGQPPAVHALTAAINAQLGSAGRTVRYLPVEDRPTHLQAIRSLVEQLNAGEVTTLLILGGNPVYDAPAELDFAGALARAGTSIHLSAYDDETSRRCHWHVNRAHYLEAWGDARSFDGTLSVVQPLIQPLFDGLSPIELLAGLMGEPVADGYGIVRRAWGPVLGPDFERPWRRVVHDGLWRDDAPRTAAPPVRAAGVAAAVQRTQQASRGAAEFEVVFRPDRKVFDGRSANNGWLQELPDPITKVVWDNAAVLSPADAARLGVAHGDVVRLTIGARQAELPVFVLPGQAPGSVDLALGYGRRSAGHVGDGVGVNTFALRESAGWWTAPGQVAPAGRRQELVTTQDHYAIDRVGMEARGQRVREFVRELPLAAYLHGAGQPHGGGAGHGAEAGPGGGHTVPLPLFDDPVNFQGDPAIDYQWGMAVDLNCCVGCNACVVACQAENNTPIVGREQVGLGREMHWIRIDRYFAAAGDPREAGRVEAVHQPVACVHCETAPCEQVCPVAATTHSQEGLNMMVYNRCVGTRYCANNCPYKVRRFNYLNWHAHDPRRTGPAPPHLAMPDTQEQQVDLLARMVHNPDVTVRSRGVMEKCTYCVQRIEAARATAKNEGRKIADGEVTPACAQTCPAQAIVFGNLKDPHSRVSRLLAGRRTYGLLAELNVRPRTQYLTRLRNPPGPDHA